MAIGIFKKSKIITKMKKINLKRLFLVLVIISVNLSFGQGSKSQSEELKGTAAGFVKAETVKEIENNLVKALGAEHNSRAVSTAMKKMWESAKGLNKQQAKILFERFSNASVSSLREFAKMSPSRLGSYVRDVTHSVKFDSRTLKNIIYGVGDKAGNATLKVMTRIDKMLAETGTVSVELLKKMKSEASYLDPKRASAVYDLFKKKLSGEWSELKNLKDTKSGLGKYVGTVVDGVFVLNDAVNIYYSDDDPEVKGIQATAKIIDYSSSTAAGAASAALGGGLGPGLVIAFSANRVSTLYTEIAMLQKERADAKNAEKNEKIDNGILVRRQLVNISKKIELGQLRNADFLINRVQKFLLKNNVENSAKLMDLTKDLEAKSKDARRNEKINGIINKARSPYSKALYYYKRGVELNIAKIYASEALEILNNNLKTYPEIGKLHAIPNVKKLIKAINNKIDNAKDLVITGTNAPKKVYPGQFLEIGVFVKGGIPYYHSAGLLTGNISDDNAVTFYWQAPSKPGKEILNLRVVDCMGNTASTSVSIEVVENIADNKEELNLEDIDGIVKIDDNNTNFVKITPKKVGDVSIKITPSGYSSLFNTYSGYQEFKIIFNGSINEESDNYKVKSSVVMNKNILTINSIREDADGFSRSLDKSSAEIIFNNEKTMIISLLMASEQKITFRNLNPEKPDNVETFMLSVELKNIPITVDEYDGDIFFRYDSDDSQTIKKAVIYKIFMQETKLVERKRKTITSTKDNLNDIGAIDFSIDFDPN